jgi:uncharacterized protein (TIGR03437 family)
MLVAAAAVWGQATPSAPEWRKVGSAAFDRRLAAPATGPVDRVWFSPEGGVLFARTQSGHIFQTADFSSWMPAPSATEPPPATIPSMLPARLPETGVRLASTAVDPTHIYALGRQLYGSEDGGRSWRNLTALRSTSVVGGGMHDVAIAPGDPNQIVLANDFGVWRSLDGGLTWGGMNTGLPNLQVRRILATQGPAGGARIQVDGAGPLELQPGGSVWEPVQPAVDTERALMEQYSAVLNTEISAVGVTPDRVYVGSAQGQLWVLRDGVPGLPTLVRGRGRVERIFVDPAAPDFALVALAGSGAHVMRTTNGGVFWDELDWNLPAAPAHAVTADRASGSIYVATDKGVFYGHADLQAPTRDAVNWVSLTERFGGADGPIPAEDVRLDPTGAQLYVALEGYGVYAALAPHRLLNPQIVNAADYSTRPAAPGSLLSVLGTRVNAAHGASLNYPVLAASDGESQIQVPFEAVGPNVSLQLDTASGMRTLPVMVQPVSPAILVGRDGTPALFDADTGLPLDGHNAAHSNGRVQIMVTGLGKVRPNWPTGTPAPLTESPVVEAPVHAFLDGTPLQVTRATLAGGYVGFYIVEVQLPSITNLGLSSLYISAEGQESNRAQILLEP